MHIIVCLDNRNGMSFGGRRQSMDRLVREDMLRCYAPLHMSSYSAGQFRETGMTGDDAFLEHARAGDHCFVENICLEPYLPGAEKITVYRWNRDYPADLYFPSLEGYQCVESRDFSGHSHPNITKEVYIPWQNEKQASR